MEDQHINAEDSQKGEQEMKVSKHRKPPDRRRHQMEMEYVANLICEKEGIFKSLRVSRSEIPGPSVDKREEINLSKLRHLKDEIEKRMKRKQVIAAELKGLSEQLQKKTETCTKLQASLRYKDEKRTNNAIIQLENHLSTYQLKLSEEKKIVSEIDSLKRSKKTLSEYISVKQDVENLRQSQSKLRHERDTLIRETHEIRAKENDIKTFLDKKKTDEPAYDKDLLKKEIDGLYEKRRDLHSLFKQEMASYREEQKKMEKSTTRKKAVERREEMRVSKTQAPERRRQETRPEIQPFEEEKNICICLVNFLESQRLQPLNEVQQDKPATVLATHVEVGKSEFNETEASKNGSFVMKKNNNDLDGLFAVSSRRISRKGSKKGRKSKDFSQKLVLHPHVLEQFIRLNIHPPSTFADVEKTLEQLNEKKELYQNAAITISPQSPLKPETSQAITIFEEPSLDVNTHDTHVNIASESEKETRCTIGDNGGQDEDAVLSSTTQASDSFSRATELAAESGATEMPEISGTSSTRKDSHGDESEHDVIYPEESHGDESEHDVIYPEESHGDESEHDVIYPEIKERDSEGESPTIEEEEILEDKERKCDESFQERELIRNKENSEESISKTSKSVDCSFDFIAETIEKSLESIGMNEASKEIQVRAT